jgi:hypothetical protein
VGLKIRPEWKQGRTFAVENFLSVATTAPLRWAALSALFPLTVVSRSAPGPRALLPILVTVSQSLILKVLLWVLEVVSRVGVSWSCFVRMLLFVAVVCVCSGKGCQTRKE